MDKSLTTTIQVGSLTEKLTFTPKGDIILFVMEDITLKAKKIKKKLSSKTDPDAMALLKAVRDGHRILIDKYFNDPKKVKR